MSAFISRGVPPAPTPSQRKASLQLPLSLETLGRALPFLGWELPAYGVVWKGNSSWGCKRLQVVGSWETVHFLLGVGFASCLERNGKRHRQLEAWGRAPQVYIPDQPKRTQLLWERGTHRLWKPFHVLCGWHLRAHQPSHSSSCRHQSSLMVSQRIGDPQNCQRERANLCPRHSPGF